MSHISFWHRVTLADATEVTWVYVIKCFCVLGFDSEEVITSMDLTSDGQGNTIKAMEA